MTGQAIVKQYLFYKDLEILGGNQGKEFQMENKPLGGLMPDDMLLIAI